MAAWPHGGLFIYGFSITENFSKGWLILLWPSLLHLYPAMQFLNPIMWTKPLFILWLIHSTIARPQDLLDTPPSFLSENQLGESSGMQLIASGYTSSDSNHETQQEQWTEDPKVILLAGVGCNDAVAPNKVLHSRSQRSRLFTRHGEEICIPDDRTQLFKQPEEAQPPGGDAVQPLPLDPTSGNPKRPGKRKKPAKGIGRDALPLYNAIYDFPGEDGKPDYEVCNISKYPLLRVPICALPQPYSPISMVLPARFCKFLFLFFLKIKI